MLDTFAADPFYSTLGYISSPLNLVSGGAGYTAQPTITIAGGGAAPTVGGSGGAAAGGTAATGTGTVTGLTLATGGAGYTLSAPTVTFSASGSTTPAKATANLVRTATASGGLATMTPQFSRSGAGILLEGIAGIPIAGSLEQADGSANAFPTPLTPAATTTAITVNPPTAATKLVFTVEPPSTITAGSTFTVAVSVEDASGNVLTAQAATATILQIANNPGGSTLGGATRSIQVNTSGGVATFSGVALTKPGIDYVLQATQSGRSRSPTRSASTSRPRGPPNWS